MKQLRTGQGHNGFTVLLWMLQFIAYNAAAQQEQTLNINVNDVYNNVNVINNQSLNNRNVNPTFPTGPNGRGSGRMINVNTLLIDNGSPNTGGPNVRGYTSSLISNQTLSNQLPHKPKTRRPVAVQKATPKRVVSASGTQRPKPKPKATTTVAKRTVARPVAPVVAAAVIATPVATGPVPEPVSNPFSNNGNESVVVAQAMNSDDIVQPQVIGNVPAPAVSTVSAPAVRSSAASGGSGSSGKSHRFGRKKHGSFYYHTNKKLMKLFAKTKNRKFDPAKCFVWK